MHGIHELPETRILGPNFIVDLREGQFTVSW